MSRERRSYVAATRTVLEAQLSGTEFAVWVLLARFRSHNTRESEVFTSRARLMADLGRKDAAPVTISRATARLQRHELLGKRSGRSRATGRTLTYYRLPDREGEPYVELETELLAWLAHGWLTPEELQALARWRDLCGEQGRTDDSLADYAARFGVPARTARRHRGRLVQLGLLLLDRRPGHSSVTVTPDEWTLRALLTEGPGALQMPVDNPAETPADPGQIRHTTPAKSDTGPRPNLIADPGQIRHTDRAPVDRAPVDRAPEDRAVSHHSSASLTVRARKVI